LIVTDYDETDLVPVSSAASHRNKSRVRKQQQPPVIPPGGPSSEVKITAEDRWIIDLAVRAYHLLWREADVVFRISTENDRRLERYYEDGDIPLGSLCRRRIVSHPDGNLRSISFSKRKTPDGPPRANWEMADRFRHACEGFQGLISELVDSMRTKLPNQSQDVPWIWEPLSSAISVTPKVFGKDDLAQIIREVVMGYGKFALRFHILRVAMDNLSNTADGVDDPYNPGITDNLVMGCLRDLYGFKENISYGEVTVVELDAIVYVLHRRKCKLAASRIAGFLKGIEEISVLDRLEKVIPLAVNLAAKIGASLCKSCYSFQGSDSYYPAYDHWLRVPSVDWKPESMGPVLLWPDNDQDPDFLRKYDPYVELPLAKSRLTVDSEDAVFLVTVEA